MRTSSSATQLEPGLLDQHRLGAAVNEVRILTSSPTAAGSGGRSMNVSRSAGDAPARKARKDGNDASVEGYRTSMGASDMMRVPCRMAGWAPETGEPSERREGGQRRQQDERADARMPLPLSGIGTTRKRDVM